MSVFPTVGLLTAALLAFSAPAYANDFAVGWANIVDPMQSGGIVTGSWRTAYASRANLELRVGLAVPSGTDRVDDIVPILLGIANNGDSAAAFQVPLALDKAMGDVLMDFAPQRTPGQLQIVPRARFGVGVLMRDKYAATYSGVTLDSTDVPFNYQDLGAEFVLALPADVSFEMWFPSNIGLRLSAGGVINRQLEPQYDPNTPTTEKEWVSRTRLDAALVFSPGSAQ